MKSSTKFTLMICVCAALGVFVLRSCRHHIRLEKGLEPAERQEPAPIVNPSPTPSVSPSASASPVASPSVMAVDPAVLAKKFAGSLRDMGSCLKIASGGGDSVEPTYENLVSSLRGGFGDLVTTNEEWSSTTIQLPNGHQRRMRVEMDFTKEGPGSRKLAYEELDETGQATPIPLEKEQSENPTDTFLAGLEGDGQVTSREKALRGYFPNGDEVLITETEGHLKSMEVTNLDGKKFNCANLNTLDSACQCN